MWHRVGGVPQHGQGVGKLTGQNISAFHGQDLPHFHGGAAHAGQAFGKLFGVGGRQENIDGIRRGHAGDAPHALDGATDNQFAGSKTQADKAAKAGCGYSRFNVEASGAARAV